MVEHRPVVAGMLWVERTGATWREVPAQFGPWQTVYTRYRRWRRDGLWQRIIQALQTTAPESAQSGAPLGTKVSL